MNKKRNHKNNLEKQADFTADAVRALTLLSLGGITFGTIAAIIRLLNIRSNIKETLNENVYSTASNISPELVETVSELSPTTTMYVVDNKSDEASDKQQQQLEKSGIDYEDLTGVEQYIYNMFKKNEAWYGALPIMTFLIMPMLSIGAYMAVTTLGLRMMVDNSRFNAKRKKEELEKELASITKAIEKKGHIKSAQGILSILNISSGFAAALSALVFFLSVPVFYQLFRSRQAGDVKDFIRRKILFQKLPSSVPVQLSKEDLKKVQLEEESPSSEILAEETTKKMR